MIEYSVDLHMHTSVSDGVMTPTEVIDTAFERGLKTVVIADHNSLHDNFDKIRAYASDKGVRIPFAGCEVSAVYYRGDAPFVRFHLLVYGKNESIHDERFLSIIKKVDAAPNAAVMRDLETLRENGIDVSFDELFILDPDVAPTEKSMKNSDNYLCVKVGQKLGVSADEVKEKYGVGKGGYWGDDDLSVRPDARDVIRVAREVGLVTVMAHPSWIDRAHEGDTYALGDPVVHEIIRTLTECGLDGIEVCHEENNPEQTEALRALAGELGLITTGGSDFHGELTGYGSYLKKYGATEEQLRVITALVEERGAAAFSAGIKQKS